MAMISALLFLSQAIISIVRSIKHTSKVAHVRTTDHSMYDSCDSDYDSDSSHSPSESSFDEEEVNQRVSPFWPQYRALIHSRGFRLDTVRDVKGFYIENQQYGHLPRPIPDGIDREMGDDALCPDQGLVRLYRFRFRFLLIFCSLPISFEESKSRTE